MAESEKHGEPRNQVPEEGSGSEEGWLEIPDFQLNFLKFMFFNEFIQELIKKYIRSIMEV